ncbi:Lipid transfer-like protein VAS [Dendrobium catenatum]|uniref:Lipid transfer-like protein VAS n=1 Tax=Dendrobium catenatum TaxID=906689 RepID=A0A2I0XGE3_9ASPA|nr:Lipid transfer-like protein VAS [Dendrobium catenatum]
MCSSELVAQAQDSSCLSQIVPCLQFINSNKTPSSRCCNPLQSLIRSDAQCLCSLLGSSSSKTNQAGVNMSQAHLLLARCGEKVNIGPCKSKLVW